MQIVPVTTTLAVRNEVFTTEEEQALVGFLAGTADCARRADIERFGRHLETLGRARATVARRLCTIA